MNEHVFANLNEARQIIEQWRIDYNTKRPHSSLNGLTPIEFATRTDEGKNPGGSRPASLGAPTDLRELFSLRLSAPKLNLIDRMNVYPFDRSPRWIVHFRKLLRPAKRGRCRTCNRRSDGDGETGGRILEKAVKYCPVQISLF
jgi:hypothetical protein